MYTHQFSPSQGLFRATTNNNRAERGNDGKKKKMQQRKKWGVRGREKWKKEGGLGITSANHSSPETGDELQK